jgi:hypothetical protein
MSAATAHRWDFKARFRRGAFGWRSQPAVIRVREAVAEIRKVARRDAVLAADGAVQFLERVSPALERVDSSSGAVGNAVNNAIEELVVIIRDAPADPRTRESWLDRLWAAYEEDQIPYIESLGDRWGELCASPEVASRWADELVSTTSRFLGREKGQRGFFHGTTACLSALLTAGRYDEILDLLRTEDFWPYRRWAVKALAAMGRVEEALALAEVSRGLWTNDLDLERICEEMLVSAARTREAYERYGLSAGRRGTYSAWFHAVRDRYPDVPPRQVLADLVAATPGDEGKWFAAAKDLGLYEEALGLASQSPCDPKTLARAARDFEERRPEFALDAALLALEWLAKGFGYEVTGAEVWLAYSKALSTAQRLGRRSEVEERIRELVRGDAPRGYLNQVLAREVGV